MSLQFAAPTVGSAVTVTIRSKNDFIFRTSDIDEQVYEGTVVKNFPWQQPGTFALTGNVGIPIRVIELKDVFELKTADGSVVAKETVDNSTQTVEVKGSKGDRYIVTKFGNKYSCTCVGFQFRKTCKHINDFRNVTV